LITLIPPLFFHFTLPLKYLFFIPFLVTHLTQVLSAGLQGLEQQPVPEPAAGQGGSRPPNPGRHSAASRGQASPSRQQAGRRAGLPHHWSGGGVWLPYHWSIRRCWLPYYWPTWGAGLPYYWTGRGVGMLESGSAQFLHVHQFSDR
jgi:hypothetical protein